MVDELFEIFERDKKRGRGRQGGLRGAIGRAIAGDRDERRFPDDGDHDRDERHRDERERHPADDRPPYDRSHADDGHDRAERYRNDDRRHAAGHEREDDREVRRDDDGNDGHGPRAKKRRFSDLLDFD